MSLAELAQAPGYWYIATPFSRYPYGLVAAFEAASRIAGTLIRHGVPCFSPIAHSYPIAVHGNLDPMDYEIWMPADKPMMDAAYGLIVVTLATWETSKGVRSEIEAFRDRPIHYLDPEDLP